MSGVFDDDYQKIRGELDRMPAATRQETAAAAGEIFDAAFDNFVSEEQSNSRNRWWMPELTSRGRQVGQALGREIDPDDYARSYYELTTDSPISRSVRQHFQSGDVEYDAATDTVSPTSLRGRLVLGGSSTADLYSHYYLAYGRTQAALGQMPDLATDEQIGARIKEAAAFMREGNQRVLSRTGGLGGWAARFGGTGLAAITDPMVMATMPAGYGSVQAGKTTLGTVVNIGKAMAVEGAVEMGIEGALIQPAVWDFKREIESPWGIKESVQNVLAAGAGAALFRGAVEGVNQPLRAFLKRYQDVNGAGDPGSKAFDRIVEEIESGEIRLRQDEGMVDAHMAAIQKATLDLANGRTADVEHIVSDYVPRGTAETAQAPAQGVERIPAQSLEADAQRFQYKSGADAQGVTERLQGVTEWDDRLAGISIFYEDVDGRMFVVDGHQRLGLARRLEAEGGAPIELTGYRLRAADGVTPEKARALAAVKNIAEGSGRAIDAAKVLRDAGSLKDLPQLPPRSALVRQAQGLAKLSDDVFMEVVNETIPERYAAIVGDLIDDPGEQAAAVRVLARTEPANEVQARSVVEQVRASGFERQTTEDLFGEQEIVESLVGEKAKIIDETTKRLRRDRSLFRSLVENESRIETGGQNVLDHAANLENSTDAQTALQALSRLAYRRGPVADALNDAARAVKSGRRPGDVVPDLLRAVRESVALGTDAGKSAGRPGPVGQTGRIVRRGPARGDAVTLDPRPGRPVRKADLDPADWVEAESRYRQSQQGRTLDDTYRVAESDQAKLEDLGRAIQDEIEGVEFSTPGIKARAGSEQKMARKSYRDASQLTDIVRGGFLVNSPRAADEVAARLSERFEVLDEGWHVTGAGYFDRKVLVRFEDGTIGEVQFWEPNVLRAKEVDGGHVLYERWRDLMVDGKLPAEKANEAAQLNQQMVELYQGAIRQAGEAWEELAGLRPRQASGSGISSAPGRGMDSATSRASPNAASKSARSMAAPESMTSARETGSQPSPLLRTAAADKAPPSASNTAGRASQSTNATARSSNIGTTSSESIPQFGAKQVTDDPKIMRAIDPFAEDTTLPREVMERQIREARDLLARGDLDIPDEIRINPETGEEEMVMRSARDAFDELDRQERILDELIPCVRS